MKTLSSSEYVTAPDNPCKIRGMETFGDRLRAHRESKGVTTWAVEKLTGISRSNLSSIEKGRRPASDEVLMKLAAVPELRIDYQTLKAWKLLDGVTPEEKVALLQELATDDELLPLIRKVIKEKKG